MQACEEVRGDTQAPERGRPMNEATLPADINEPVDLLGEAAKEYNEYFKGKNAARKQADCKCLEAMYRICDAMMVVTAALEDKNFKRTPDEIEKLAGRMAELGKAMAEIRGRMVWNL